MPKNFHVEYLGSRYVQLGWEEHTSSEDGLRYTLYYRAEAAAPDEDYIFAQVSFNLNRTES